MQWWAWAVAGAILLGAELGFVDAQFYLVFIGLAAILVGLEGMVGPTLPVWMQWALFAALAIVAVTTFRKLLYERLRRDGPRPVAAGPAGDLITVPTNLPPGESCQIEYRGSHWTVTNDAAEALAAGSRARIERVQGLTLHLRPDR
jgi:membrane protein implicated in regulation of membrane protease activity